MAAGIESLKGKSFAFQDQKFIKEIINYASHLPNQSVRLRVNELTVWSFLNSKKVYNICLHKVVITKEFWFIIVVLISYQSPAKGRTLWMILFYYYKEPRYIYIYVISSIQDDESFN